MKHCAGQIKYLIAIKELTDSDEYVKCVSISRHLGVSRPSVSKMLRCLANSGLVYEDYCNSVVLTPEGEKTVEEIFANFPQFGLVYLGEGDNGLRHISTTNRPIHTAADVEGLKIRVPTSQLYLDVWEALGATPVALALPELALALANGTAEAQDNATYHLVANATYDNIKYFSYINYMWMGTTIAMNSVSWSKLDADQQKIVKEAGYEAGRYGFELIKEANIEGETTLKEAGVEFDAEPDVQSFKDKLDIPAYYDRYEEESWFNRDLLNDLLAAIG